MSVQHDEKEFLSLLQRYGSEDNRRARRNTAVISFLVIAVHILGIRLTDIRALGVDITSTNEALASGICLALLLYWSAMFAITWFHDREIERERRLQGHEAAKALVARYEDLAKKVQQSAPSFHPDWNNTKRAHAAYARQVQRTRKAKRWGTAVYVVELGVPIALTVAASGLLVLDIINSIWLAEG